jgi:hypothetical protein
LDKVAKAWGLGGGGVAKGQLGFEKNGGEGVVELTMQAGVGGGVGGCKILGAASEGATGLSNHACGAGEGEVDLEDGGAAGVLVEEISCGRVVEGEALVEEDEREVVAVQGGKRCAAAGGRLNFSVELEAEGLDDGLSDGFRGDQEKGWGHYGSGSETGHGG